MKKIVKERVKIDLEEELSQLPILAPPLNMQNAINPTWNKYTQP